MGENFSVLRAEAATDSITLYWERPQGRVGTTYEIFLKDIKAEKDDMEDTKGVKSVSPAKASFILVGTTQKTHYTIEGLSADTEYEVIIKAAYMTIIHQETITIHTSKRSTVIDITK